MFRLRPKIVVIITLAMLASLPAFATLYEVNKGSSHNVVGTAINLDGDASNDIGYYTCGPTCPAIRAYNGWTYADPSGTLNAWENQTYEDAAAATYTPYNPPTQEGFGFDSPSYVYSSTYGVYWIRSTSNRYYKLRLVAIDTSDMTPATLELVELVPDGDFNGDNKPDLLWRNYSTGDVNAWFLNGVTYTGGASLFNVAGSTWRLEGTGDFNGDGKSDLIWRNYSTGAVNFWYLNGTAYLGGASLFTVADPNWEIEAVDDFNNDGKDDLLWRHYGTGAVNVWFMNGATYTGGASLFTVADLNWKIEGAGDFNNDGKTDIIWRNYSTGAVNVWFLNGTAYLGGANLFTVAGSSWNVEAVGDYNGDGKLDLIWRNYSTGEVNVWYLNNTTYLGGASLFTVAGASWEIAGPR